MEIEAKFAIPNRQTFRRLARLRELAGFTLGPASTITIIDTYLDTEDRRLRTGGYACRLRRGEQGVWVTLKGLGGATGAVHRRDEREAVIPEPTADPTAWPQGPARDLALELTGGAALRPLFELNQTRRQADVWEGQRRVAQLSLDDVRFAVGQRSRRYCELEVELADEGTEADLAALSAELMGAWGLSPEPRSKFERALATLDALAGSLPLTLTTEERGHLEALAAGGDPQLARRARAVLARADGLSAIESAARAGLSAGRARYWLRAFRSRRMAIFERKLAGPPPGLQSKRAAPESIPAAPTPTPVPPLPRAPRTALGAPTVAALCRQYGVDMAHARFVAAQARTLFDALRPVHRLPRKRRALLKSAALLNTLGKSLDPQHPAAAARDLILAQPLRGVSTTERLMLACMAAFNRNKVRPDREPTMAALDKKAQAQVLALTALLRMAEALDLSNSQSTEIASFADVHAQRCQVETVGSSAEMDAAQATAQADLWYELFNQELIFLAPPGEPLAGVSSAAAGEAVAIVSPGVPEAPAASALPPLPQVTPIQADEPMSEAGRKVLLLHFSRMLANEPGTRLGQDIEALHDMRVATRRMRAAFQVFADFYEGEIVDRLGKGLRRTGRTLGAVRDLDVLLDKARAFGSSLPPDQMPSFEPLITAWETRREVARRQMLEYLDSPSYRRFVADFGAFVSTPGAGSRPIPAGEPVPHQVRHVVPRLIMARYETVRAYEAVIPAPLPTMHMLRIDCKRLRYALEFFRDVLGPEAPGLIRQVVAMQDLLGELQDAHVAEGLVTDFLTGQKPTGRRLSLALDGVEAYLAALRAVQQEILARFPEPWAELVGPDFRRALGLAVAAL